MRNQRRWSALLFPLTHWHWKAALVTAVFRAAACMAALYRAPLRMREHFGIVEALYVLTTAGVFSAWQQQALEIRPQALAWAAVVLAIPLGSLAADFGLHLWLDPGSMNGLGAEALAVTLVSAMFHWHLMQNGAMRVGDESGSFFDDMLRMPALALSFVGDPVRWVIGRLHPQPSRAAADDLEVAA